MQGKKQFYADVSDIMSNPFIVGSDGKEWWCYCERKNEETLLTVAPFKAVAEKNIQICDPFNLTVDSVEEAMSKLNLEYLGMNTLSGRKCYMIRSWSLKLYKTRTICRVSIYWIDAETYLPTKTETDFGKGPTSYSFVYDRINKHIVAKEFLPPSNSNDSIKPQDPSPLDNNYDTRFINVIDGSNGHMSVRWGEHGEKKTRSSGLN